MTKRISTIRLVVSLLVIVGLAVGLTLYFHPTNRTKKVWTDGNYVYSEGIGKVPSNVTHPKQKKLLALEAGKANARWKVLKAYATRDLPETPNIKITLYQEDAQGMHVEGTIRGMRVLELRELSDGKYKVKVKIPL